MSTITIAIAEQMHYILLHQQGENKCEFTDEDESCLEIVEDRMGVDASDSSDDDDGDGDGDGYDDGGDDFDNDNDDENEDEEDDDDEGDNTMIDDQSTRRGKKLDQDVSPTVQRG